MLECLAGGFEGGGCGLEWIHARIHVSLLACFPFLIATLITGVSSGCQ